MDSPEIRDMFWGLFLSHMKYDKNAFPVFFCKINYVLEGLRGYHATRDALSFLSVIFYTKKQKFSYKEYVGSLHELTMITTKRN